MEEKHTIGKIMSPVNIDSLINFLPTSLLPSRFTRCLLFLFFFFFKLSFYSGKNAELHYIKDRNQEDTYITFFYFLL